MSQDVNAGDLSEKHGLEQSPESVEAGGQSDGVELGSEPVNLQLAEPPETGDPVVNEALTGLAGLQGGELQQHLDSAEATHAALQQRLSDTGG